MQATVTPWQAQRESSGTRLSFQVVASSRFPAVEENWLGSESGTWQNAIGPGHRTQRHIRCTRATLISNLQTSSGKIEVQVSPMGFTERAAHLSTMRPSSLWNGYRRRAQGGRSAADLLRAFRSFCWKDVSKECFLLVLVPILVLVPTYRANTRVRSLTQAWPCAAAAVTRLSLPRYRA
jgi:hypothetical protein